VSESSQPTSSTKAAEPCAPREGPTRKSWDDCSDLELLRSAGEHLDAFGELIRRHQDFVYGAAKRIVRNRVIAEDITHEAFLRAFRSKDEFRGDAGVRSWLYRIATNLAKNEVSRRKEWPTDRQIDLTDDADPGARLQSQALTEDVRQAIEQLPSKLREPLLMREYEELSYADIAERTGLPLNTVRTRILRARRALRPLLEDWQ